MEAANDLWYVFVGKLLEQQCVHGSEGERRKIYKRRMLFDDVGEEVNKSNRVTQKLL